MSTLSINSLGSLTNNLDLVDAETGDMTNVIRMSGPDAGRASYEAVFTDSEYLSFFVTNNSGDAIKLTSFDFQSQRHDAWDNLGDGLYSSVQGFDALDDDKINILNIGGKGTDASMVSHTIDLTSGFTGSNISVSDFTLADGDSITFMLAYVQDSNKGNRAVDFDNISVSYTQIPEPNTFALLGGLCALGFVVVRRRK